MGAWEVVGLMVVVTLLSCPLTGAFNVDIGSYTAYEGRAGSMFGFSVAQHREDRRSWILVGAPNQQTLQPNVIRGGAVYKCEWGGPRQSHLCEEIIFDPKGNLNNTKNEQLEEKSGQWFGATVVSSGQDGVVMACAPRYTYFTSKLDRRDPVGTCYVARDAFSQFHEYAPCRNKFWGYHRQGSCQAGLGAAISKGLNRLFIGAVGSYYWQGQLYSVSSAMSFPYLPPRFSSGFFGAGEGQIISMNLPKNASDKPVVLSTGEGPAAHDDSYLGYSVTTGDFLGRGQQGVAVGMPRGADLRGQVILYTWNLTNIRNITGVQLGAYFGYSLCSSDVDGNGVDDIIIGAPMFTHYGNNEGKYETGRVYIVYSNRPDLDSVPLDGVNSKARFGLSLTTLNDINMDGYGDFAVGAPYDGPQGSGAVYIYHGSANGVRTKVSQVIFAEDIRSTFPLKTFGFSVSGGQDLDDNEYPDLVVGAYDSSAAVFFRSRPVVKVNGALTFVSDSKQISLDDKTCMLSSGIRVPCVVLNTCLNFTGVGVGNTIELQVEFVLDAKKPKSPRLFFTESEGRNVLTQSVVLDRALLCTSKQVYLKPSLRDKLTPIEAEIRYTLVEEELNDIRLRPILDLDEPPLQRDSISIKKNCLRKDKCIPDLDIIVKPNVDRYLLGSRDRLELSVTVQNRGEDAFESTFNLQVPPGLDYVKIERLDKFERDIPVQCSPPTNSNNYTLHCDIGNPLPKNKFVNFKAIFQPSTRKGMKPSYEFFMVANSTNPEEESTTRNNVRELVVPIRVDTELILSGSSHPEDVHYDIALYREQNVSGIKTEQEFGPQVQHVYLIRNRGPSDINEAEAYFLWPAYTRGGEHLLYLLEQPETSGPVKCEYVQDVNPLKIQLDEKRKTYLEVSGLAASSALHSARGTVTKVSSGDSTASSGAAGGARGVTVHETTEHLSSAGGIRTHTASGSRTQTGSRTSWSSSTTGGGSSSTYRGAGGSSAGYSGSAGSAGYSGSAGSAGYSGSAGSAGYSGSAGSAGYSGSAGSAGYSGGTAGSTVYGGSVGGSVGGSTGGFRTVEEKSYWEERERKRIAAESQGANWNRGGVNEGRVTYGEEGRRQETTQGGSGISVTEAKVTSVGGGTGYRDERISGSSGAHDTYGAGGSSSVHEVYDGSVSASGYQGGRVYGGYEAGAAGAAGSVGGAGAAGSASGAAGAGRTHTYSREHSTNTTWNSRDGSRPFVSTSSNWSISEDGNVRRGGSSTSGYGVINGYGPSTVGYGREYEGSAEHRTGATWNSQTDRGQSGSTTVDRSWNAQGHTSGGGYHSSSDAVSSHIAGTVDAANSGESGDHFHWNQTRQGGSRVRGGASGVEIASRGQGAHGTAITSMLDLGVMTSGAGGQGGHSQAGGSAYSQGSSLNAGTAGSTGHYSGSYEQHGQTGYTTSRQYSSSDYRGGSQRGYEEIPESGENYGSRTYSGSHEDYVNDVGDHGRVKGYTRNKRAARNIYDEDGLDAEPSEPVTPFQRELESTLKCDPVKCVRIKCLVGPLGRNQEALVAFRSRLVAHTVLKLLDKEVDLSSTASAHITQLPHIGTPNYVTLRTQEVSMKAIPNDLSEKSESVALWVVVLSAVAGALILMLLVYLLYKCGFFKRNRPSDAPEKQPLNRNGHYQSGDEAL